MKRLLVVIDNDAEFFQSLRRFVANSSFEQEHELELLNVVELTDFQSVTDKIAESRERISAVLLDVVLFELGTNSEILAVRQLVPMLRSAIPDVPIIYITRHLDGKYLPLISWASLSDIDGILFKQYFNHRATPEFGILLPFNPEKFDEFIESARHARVLRTDAPTPVSDVADSRRLVSQLYNPDWRVKVQIDEIGPTPMRYFLDEIIQKAGGRRMRGALSYFSSGFSGASLFQYEEISDEAQEILILIKVGARSKIELEYENHAKYLEVLGPSVVPELVPYISHYGGMAAFGMKVLSNVQTLGDYLSSSSLDEDWVFDELKQQLSLLSQSQGSTTRGIARVWNDDYAIGDDLKIKILGFLEQYKSALQAWCDASDLSFVRELTEGKSVAALSGRERVTSGVIHGDLHSRNVLVNPTERTVHLIDFAHTGLGLILKDPAKLDVDLVLALIGSPSWRQSDWNCIPTWQDVLHEGESPKEAGDARLLECAPTTKTRHFLTRLRNHLWDGVTPAGEMIEYRIARVGYCLRYLTYPDINLPKKALAVSWISQLLNDM